MSALSSLKTSKFAMTGFWVLKINMTSIEVPGLD